MLVYGFPLKCQREGLWADHGGMSETPNRPFMCKDDGVDKKMRFSQSMPNILGSARRNERDCWLLIYLLFLVPKYKDQRRCNSLEDPLPRKKEGSKKAKQFWQFPACLCLSDSGNQTLPSLPSFLPWWQCGAWTTFDR